MAEALGDSPKCCDQWPRTDYSELGLRGWLGPQPWLARCLLMASALGKPLIHCGYFRGDTEPQEHLSLVGAVESGK